MSKPPYVTKDNKFDPICPCPDCQKLKGADMEPKPGIVIYKVIDDEKTGYNNGRVVDKDTILVESEFLSLGNWLFEINQIHADGTVVLKPVNTDLIDKEYHTTTFGHCQHRFDLSVETKYTIKESYMNKLNHTKYRINNFKTKVKERITNRLLKYYDNDLIH